MAEQFFGGAPNAFAGGMEFGAMQRARQQQENALAALIQRFGPAAANPQALAMLQQTEQRAQMHPLDMEAVQRANAAQAAVVAKHGAVAGDPEAHKRDLALRLSAAKRAASVLSLTKQRKGDLGRAFDFVQSALPAIGIPQENLATIRQAIIEDPDKVDELVALLQDPESNSTKGLSGGVAMRNRETGQLEWVIPTETGYRVIPGYTPAAAQQADERLDQGAVRLGQGARRLSIREAELAGFKAPTGFQIWQEEDGRIVALPHVGSEQETELDAARTELETKERKFISGYGVVNSNAEIVTREANRALPYFQKARDGIIPQSARLGLKLIPGTEAFDANDAIKEIQSKVSIDALQQMRQNSPTGGAMGNVSDKDIEILQSALGRLNVERDPSRNIEDIKYIIKEYNRILGLAKRDAERANARIREREQRRTTRAPTAPGPKQPDAPAPNAFDTSLDDLLNKYAPVRNE